MLKQSLTKLLAVFLVTAGTIGAQAQTVIWGAGHPDSTINAHGQFSGMMSVGDTAGMNPSGAWMIDTMACGAKWEWDADGEMIAGALTTDVWIPQGVGQWITSPSISNGCAMFKSDIWENNAQGSPWIGAGTCPVYPGYHTASMYSPLIDLSAYVDSTLQLDFHASYLDFLNNPHTVGISTDGGATWTDINFSALSGGSGVRS
ncbi:MAG: hypothetical protein MK212_12990, partial [Saprospiraceae bacterium]|nr:hypothetical protein [Saprospiraceae bacterium]